MKETSQEKLKRVRKAQMKLTKEIIVENRDKLIKFHDIISEFNQPKYEREEEFFSVCPMFCDGIRISMLKDLFKD